MDPMLVKEFKLSLQCQIMVNADLLKLKPEEINIIDLPNREKAFIIPIHSSVVESKVGIETDANPIIENLVQEFGENNIFSYRNFLFLDNGLIRAYYNGIGAIGLTMENAGKKSIAGSMVSFSNEKCLAYDPGARIRDSPRNNSFSSYVYTSKNVLNEVRARFLINFGCRYLNAVIDELDKKGALID